MDYKTKPQFGPALLLPRYWLTWLWFGLWALVAQLPFRAHLWNARVMGALTYHLAKSRRLVAQRNIALCFPELSSAEQEQLVRDNFTATALAVFETGMAWFWPKQRLGKLLDIEGLERLQDYQSRGQGAILLTLHFTTLEMCGVAINSRIDNLAMTYRPHRNPVYDWIQSRQRSRHNPHATTVAAGDVRGMVRALKAGRFVSYFPDQDYGPKHSVFASFFGNKAATVTALARLARMASVPVVPLLCIRQPGTEGYQVRVMSPWEDYPSGDDHADARRLNAHVEDCVRLQPDQYLWVHRRFKTRPPGESPLYPPRKRSRRRR